MDLTPIPNKSQPVILWNFKLGLVCYKCSYYTATFVAYFAKHSLYIISYEYANMDYYLILFFCFKLLIIGTPAEEGGGGKILLLERGAFADVDVVLMAHPNTRNIVRPIHLCGQRSDYGRLLKVICTCNLKRMRCKNCRV